MEEDEVMPESAAMPRVAGETSVAVNCNAGTVAYSHVLTVRTSSNRRHTLTAIGIVVREIGAEGASRRVVLRHSEAHWHSPDYEAEALAVVRSLEVAIEHGYIRLVFQSPYRVDPHLHRHPRYSYWDDSLRARFAQLLTSFISIQFAVPARTERTARILARRARANAPARPPRVPVPEVDESSIDSDDLLFVDDRLDEGLETEWFRGALDDHEIPF